MLGAACGVVWRIFPQRKLGFPARSGDSRPDKVIRQLTLWNCLTFGSFGRCGHCRSPRGGPRSSPRCQRYGNFFRRFSGKSNRSYSLFHPSGGFKGRLHCPPKRPQKAARVVMWSASAREDEQGSFFAVSLIYNSHIRIYIHL